ncbi:arylesterase [Taklimakanibacter albus]|uniref:Arylesterase n=1 Tax=Taklimakanibacter albus TaxID=2800327 RepID=A0ACC5QWW6_9HYPH|nr:arylesterase [Aestuariivirga sp. YIM B02566]MBK1864868.1 arylesterase [Aestuariivirga sp. YIM B02566]
MRFGFLAFCLGLLLAFSPLQAQSLRILALGDSLTAGLGVDPADAFPAKLEAALKARGHDIVITNAGVSGDTSTAGAERLDWALGDPVDAVILELGANDALRGIDPDQTEKALDRILTEIKKRNLPVLFAGMLAPRNLGPDYGKKFDALFPRLAQKHGVLFYPFFLDGVAADPALNQPDGLHPNSKGVDMIVSRILPITEDLLKQASSK